MHRNHLLHPFTKAVCAILCLSILLCITSCFNLSSPQRGNFSFTIDDAIAQQLDNALGPRAARSAESSLITATVTLEKSAGGQLATPVTKTGTTTSLIGETFTFEDLPLHVQFVVKVSFSANGKELFAGTSEPITLSSADTTPVVIALYQILDTDIVVPFWEYIGGDYAPIGFRASSADDLNPLPDLIRSGDFDYANTTGAITSCFDSYGNVWSIDKLNSEFRMGTYSSLGLEGLYFSGSKPFECNSDIDMFTTGFLRALIPGACCIACDYATNELYIICDIANDEGDYEYLGTNIVKLSVDEMLSYNPESDFVLPSYIENLNAYTELIANMNGIGYQITYVPSLLSGYGNLYDILGTDVPDPVDPENLLQYGDITSFTVNNGIMYVGYAVLDSNDDIIDWSFASINPATGSVKHTEKNISAIFGINANKETISITDMLFLDGKLYMLVSYGGTSGALVRIDPVTLSFSERDVLGVCKDCALIPLEEDPTDGVWLYNKDGKNCNLGYSHQEYSPSQDKYIDTYANFETANSTYKLPKGNSFAGPVKFSAIKPKKLIVADCGFYYVDENTYGLKNRLVTINLSNFSIETIDNLDTSVYLINPSDENDIPVSYVPDSDFTYDKISGYNKAGFGATAAWENISFTEEQFATMLADGTIFFKTAH